MSKRTLNISEVTYNVILNELNASRDSFRTACREQKIDIQTSDEPEAQEFRAIDVALQDIMSN